MKRHIFEISKFHNRLNLSIQNRLTFGNRVLDERVNITYTHNSDTSFKLRTKMIQSLWLLVYEVRWNGLAVLVSYAFIKHSKHVPYMDGLIVDVPSMTLNDLWCRIQQQSTLTHCTTNILAHCLHRMDFFLTISCLHSVCSLCGQILYFFFVFALFDAQSQSCVHLLKNNEHSIDKSYHHKTSFEFLGIKSLPKDSVYPWSI